MRENIRNLIKEEFKDDIARERAIAEQIEAEKAKAEIEKAKAEAENVKTDIALKLLADNKYSSEDICRLTGLSIDEILDLKKKLN